MGPGLMAGPSRPEDSSCQGPSIVAGVIENRAKEVGVAALDLSASKLTLMQFAEVSRTYTTVLRALLLWQPSMLVTLTPSRDMHDVNKATRAHYQQIPLGRGAFDDTKAALTLESLADHSSRRDLQSSLLHKRHYLAFGAAGAALQYVEQDHGEVFAAGSLAIEYRNISDHMHIDIGGIQALELIEPISAGSGTSKRNSSLFHRLRQTKTLAGARLLRVGKTPL